MEIFEGVLLYDWVPYFRELAESISEIGKDVKNRNTLLKQKASQAFGAEHVLNKFELIDPFSFIYSVAQKNNVTIRDEIYQRIIDSFGLKAKLPTDTVYPSPANNAKVGFYTAGDYVDRDGNKVDINILWDTFIEAYQGTINPNNFRAVLSLNGVRISKFSQVLFVINPHTFWSIDENSLWLPIYDKSSEEIKTSIETEGTTKYFQILEFIKSFFPGCEYYEINLLCWLLSGSDPLLITDNYCQISSKLEGSDGRDYYDEFVQNSAVWPGGGGKHLGGYGLSKVKDGDVVLIRRGIRNLGGIGIIIQNEFEDGDYDPDKAIYIVWMNKESRKLDYGLGDWKGFNEKVTDDTYEKFYSKYSDTLDLIERMGAKQMGLPFNGIKINRMANTTKLKSLNTILYGPPGTGKTFNTIIKAAKIITGKDLEYNEAKAVFEPLLGDQVEFITFHQNYSYEDFVVGLRPKLEGSQLAFEKHKGVFYKICANARDNYNAWKEGLKPTEPTFEKVFFEYLKPLQTAGGEIEVKLGIGGKNIYITDSGGNMLQYRSENGATESLNTDTLKALYSEAESPKDSKHTYYTPVAKALHDLAEQLKKEVVKVELKKYVLIIDEINRANISRVFGELITLLETDKRLGNLHQMVITLSTGETFSVPNNLYIIGTMNTADKSIALVDIALRRRFVFEPMYPNLDLVESPFKEFLKILNEQILKNKSADFLIGHSYLMRHENEQLDFESALNHQVIPLLNEYFYNNRSVGVYSLLAEAIKSVPNYKIVEDPYTGAICQKA